MRSPARKLAFVCLAACSLAACLLDLDRECGPNQDLNVENVCVCKPNAVPSTVSPGACELCRADQVALAGKCVCAEGLVESVGGTCQPKPSGLGEACDPAQPNCTNPAFAFCEASVAGGYCTKAGCSAAADCPSGYRCDKTMPSGVCRRTPIGEGKMCGSDAECAGTEASVCGAPLLGQCLAEGCQLGVEGACSSGYNCCDLTKFGLAKTLCIPRACP